MILTFLERFARFCVGFGLLWVAGVLFVGLFVSLEAPGRWFSVLDHLVGAEAREWAYLAMAFFVVPLGMLVYLQAVFRDPVPIWMKAGAPGAFLSVYLLFLASALPDVGRPLLLAADPAAAALAPAGALRNAPDATWSWLLRFGALFALLAGAPGLVGMVAAFLGGLVGDPRR